MPYEHLLVERDGSVLTVVINRPGVLNALSVAVIEELDRAMAEAAADSSVGAIVLTGAGERAFAAGADIAELASDTPVTAVRRARQAQDVFGRVENLLTPVVAAVNGVALGGGCELAMACTMRIASDTARFGLPEINLGVMPAFGGTQRLPRLIGRGRALELLLTGVPIDAGEAWRVGLVNRVVAGKSLRNEATTLAQLLASKARLAGRNILRAVNEDADLTRQRGEAREAELFGATMATADAREGIAAFLQKRTPVFEGR